ncbi:MAG: GNAT family N-acetyltransferase [Rubricoccaceae bacterium]
MPSAHTIRRARPEEAERLTDIALASKSHWDYPQTWIDVWRDGLTFTEAYITENAVYVAVDEDNTPIACYALEGTGAEIQLEHVWVLPTSMGLGLGKALVAHAADTASSLGATALLIHSDPNAEPFYEKLGAVTIGSVRADVCGERRELPRTRYELPASHA